MPNNIHVPPPKRGFVVEPNPTYPDQWLDVNLREADGTLLGTAFRIKEQDGRFCFDRQGVSAALFHVTESGLIAEQ